MNYDMSKPLPKYKRRQMYKKALQGIENDSSYLCWEMEVQILNCCGILLDKEDRLHSGGRLFTLCPELLLIKPKSAQLECPWWNSRKSRIRAIKRMIKMVEIKKRNL